MLDWGPAPVFLLFGLGVVLVIVVGIISYRMEQKRREALAAEAARLGFRFRPEKDFEMARQFQFLDRLRQGSDRYAYNILDGNFGGYPMVVFDYHYTTTSTDSKGRHQTQHHYHHVAFTLLPGQFPELEISPENIFDKIAAAIGFDDIDFESAEFSRRYKVKSKDRKFAFAFCHARMIEYLLSEEPLVLELEGDVLATIHDQRLRPENVQPLLDELVGIRELMPDYLFADS